YPMRRGHTEGRMDRQGRGCGIRALRTGARHRSQQCPRPDGVGIKFFMPAAFGFSGDPKGDLERADQLESKALALDPDYAWAHDLKGTILLAKGRPEEALPEHERALALDPSNMDAAGQLGFDYERLGEFD